MSFEDLRKEVLFLSQLFRGEFIFPPEGLDTNLAKSFKGLESDNVLKITRVPEQLDKIESIQISDKERESGRENFDFYCFLIWPFIEASWLGAVSLMMLTPPVGHTGDHRLPVKQVQDCAQVLGKTLYHQGDLSYFEAVNKETLKNAYQRFEEDGIIIVTKSREGRVAPTLTLAPEWMPSRDPETGHILPSGQLWNFAEAISQSRREGKNRRDGKTVQTRVLTLVDLVGEELWEQQAVGKGIKVPSVENEELKAKTRRRRKTIQAASRL
jgi:hypothetical protein